jgi:hypothetical protein
LSFAPWLSPDGGNRFDFISAAQGFARAKKILEGRYGCAVTGKDAARLAHIRRWALY